MSQPFVGEIRMFGGNFAPNGWQFCNGQLLSVADNQVLFTLIGTTYGGDGVNTFALPDLQCRLPLHQGTGQGVFVLGQKAGEENHTLLLNEIPLHPHTVAAKNVATSPSPAGNVFAGGGISIYKAPPPTASMNSAMVKLNSGGQPHDNVMPFQAISFIISQFGVFPSRG
jgi:microcystin-dependent protein